MTHLFTLGCSLAPEGGWPHAIKTFIPHDKHTHYDFGGGGNEQLLDCIDEFVLHNQLKDMVLVYQITGMMRGGRLFQEHEINPEYMEEIRQGTSYSLEWNGEFGNQWMLWTDRFPEVKKRHPSPPTLTTRLASTLIMLAQAGATVYTFRGWSGVFSQNKPNGETIDNHTWNKFSNITSRNGVYVLETSLVDWCFENNKEFWDDGWHPRTHSSRDFIDANFAKFERKDNGIQ